MEDHYKPSNEINKLQQNKNVRVLYGHIIDILSIDDEDYYIPLVGLEESRISVDVSSHYIPLDEPTENLVANYGSPKELIGKRVRIEFFGTSWRKGVARIVPGRNRSPIGNSSEMPSRGFRFAVAGGGS